MPAKTPQSPMVPVASVLVRVAEALRDGGCPAASQALAELDAHAGTLAEPRRASHLKHLAALRESLRDNDARGALRNLSRVREVLVPAANDVPFGVGDPVSVVRSRHGWHDGRLAGRVASRAQSAEGSWSYEVEDEEGGLHEVRRTRDLRPGP